MLLLSASVFAFTGCIVFYPGKDHNLRGYLLVFGHKDCFQCFINIKDIMINMFLQIEISGTLIFSSWLSRSGIIESKVTNCFLKRSTETYNATTGNTREYYFHCTHQVSALRMYFKICTLF